MVGKFSFGGGLYLNFCGARFYLCLGEDAVSHVGQAWQGCEEAKKGSAPCIFQRGPSGQGRLTAAWGRAGLHFTPAVRGS